MRMNLYEALQFYYLGPYKQLHFCIWVGSGFLLDTQDILQI